MRVLLTGFEAFNHNALNPSQELLKSLSEMQKALPRLVISGVVLPVTFKEAFEKAKEQVLRFNPDAVLSLGLAGGRAKMSLERIAINCIDAEIPDNIGAQPRDLKIEASGPAAYFSTLPLRQMLEAMSAVPSEISNSAGTYVCNYLMYRLLHEFNYTSRMSGFLHLPYSSEMGKTPALSLQEMRQGLIAALSVLGEK